MRVFAPIPLCVAVLMTVVGQARAGLIISIVQSGDDLTANASGSINTTDLTEQLAAVSFSGNGGLADFGAAPNSSRGLGFGGGAYTLMGSDTLSGPQYPFSEINLAFSSVSGDRIGIGASGSQVGVLLPSASGGITYTSGTAISSTGKFLSHTSFSDLGVSDGDSFTWTWGSGTSSDFMTLNVGSVAPSPVPEPSSLALLGIGGIGMAFGAARRRRKTEQAA